MRQFKPPRSDNVEEVELYKAGGFHPVHIGDLIDAKYKVVHKLGFGGNSTVWLARDPHQKLVAVEVSMAIESIMGVMNPRTETLRNADVARRFESCPGYVKMFVDLPFGHFRLMGPNGTHVGIVSVCHGDLTSSNILLKVANIDSWTDEKIYACLGNPSMDNVRPVSYDSEVLESAPKYLVEPADLTQLLPHKTGNIRIIDFGKSYYPSKGRPPPRGTPNTFCPPESLFKGQFFCPSDVWALGCAIFEMRSGVELFEYGMFGGDGEVAMQMIELLGPLPREYQNDEETTTGSESMSLMARIKEIGIEAIYSDSMIGSQDSAGGTSTEEFDDEDKNDQPEALVQSEDKSDGASAKEAHGEEDADRPKWLKGEEDLAPAAAADEAEEDQETGERGSSIVTGKSKPISREEAECLFDILSGTLRYDSTKRFLAEEMLIHPWFSLNFDA